MPEHIHACFLYLVSTNISNIKILKEKKYYEMPRKIVLHANRLSYVHNIGTPLTCGKKKNKK